MIFPAGSRIVGYFRDSGGSAQELSIPQQIEKVSEWCKSNGVILSRVYRDDARSGTTTAGRDAFLSMLRYLDDHVPEKGIVVWELSRFSRNFTDAQFYIADLRRQGYAIHSMTDNIPDTLDGKLLESVRIWMNAKFSQDLSRNVSRGIKYMVKMHKSWRWRIPPGYRLKIVVIGTRRNGEPRSIKALEPDPEKAPLVRRMFEMRLAGATLSEMHSELHLFRYLGHYTRMLRNPIYIGTFMSADKDTVVEDYCEPLIEKETFYRVQGLLDIRATRKGTEHPRIIRSRYFLSGLLVHTRCMSSMHGRVTVKKNGKRYEYYICNGHLRIRKEVIEKRVIDIVVQRILQPDLLERLYAEIVSQAQAANEGAGTESAQIVKDLAKKREDIGRIVDAIREIGHSQALVAELTRLEQEEIELQKRQAQIEARSKSVEIPEFGVVAGAIRGALENASEPQKGVILRDIIKVIRVEKIDDVISGEVEYYLPVNDRTQSYIMPL